MRTRTLRIAAAVLGLLLPGTALAQVANPAPQALGLGGNYTALARGLAAPAWNPAGLGMPDNPGVSFAVLPFGANAGLSPVTPGDLMEYSGELIPDSVRSRWVNTIIEEDGELGTVGAGVTYLGLSLGRFALSASSSVRGRVNMAPDVAKVFFFGNAGFTGEPEDLTLEGSNFDMAGTSTLAASFAVPLSLTLGPLPDQHLAVGATVKYVIGNFLMLGQENGSTFSASPISVDVQFPMVHTAFPDSADADQSLGDILDNGSGYGLDVGAAWQGGMFSAGAVVKNVFNTFEWNLENLRFRNGTATWNSDTTTVDFDTAAIETAPQELIDRIQDLYTFGPVLQAGAAAQVLPALQVTGELRHAIDDDLNVGARNHVGLGAELTLIPFLPLRAGVAAITGGYQLSGGAGLKLGGLQLSAAVAARETELGSEARGAIGLTFGLP